MGTAYVHTVRNTPLTIMMTFAIFWGGRSSSSPSHDFDTNFFVYAVIALSIYHSAFICEAIRSGVNTVPRVRLRRHALSVWVSSTPPAW